MEGDQLCFEINLRGSPEWHSGLRHCIAVLEAALQTRLRSKPLSQLAMTGRPMRRCTIGPASSGLGEGLAGRDFGRMHADTVARCTVFPPTRFLRHIGAAGFIGAAGLIEKCVEKQCGLVGSCFGGCMALGICLSRVPTGVAAMGQDCNYQLDTTKLGEKRGK